MNRRTLEPDQRQDDAAVALRNGENDRVEMRPIRKDTTGMTRIRNLWRDRTFLEKILLLLLILVITVVLALSIALGISKKERICNTPGCVATAAYLISAMNMSEEPCEDFYSFACGGYQSKILYDGDSMDRLTKITKDILLRMKNLLEEPHDEDDPEHWTKTKEFYQKCMDIDDRQKLKGQPLETDFKKLGGWPMVTDKWNAATFSWNDTLKMMFELGYDKDIILSVELANDLRDPSKLLFVVDQPKLTMPRVFYVQKPPDDTGMQAYKQFITKCAAQLSDEIKIDDKFTKELNDAVGIEKRLAEVSLSSLERKDFLQLYKNNTMTYREFKRRHPGVSWDILLGHFIPEGRKLTDDTQILVPVPPIVTEAVKIVTDQHPESKRKLANYMMYRLALMAAPDLSYDFAQSSYDFQDELNDEKYTYPEPWEACVDITKKYFYQSLSSIYVQKYFREGMKENVVSVRKAIKEMLEDEIKHAPWVDGKTEAAALRKIGNMGGMIGYPKEMLNDSHLNNLYDDLLVNNSHFWNVREAKRFFWDSDEEELHHQYKDRLDSEDDLPNLLVANAFYSPTENSIVIPVGILQEEIFSVEKPNFFNYGSLGTILGHELTHAFDMTGSQFDENGHLKYWWTEGTHKKFRDRSQCFIDQYDGYTVPELNGIALNGNSTVSENIADTGGVLIAYKAYQKWVKEHGEEKPLPGLPYTPNQLFWLSFASVWCSKESDAILYISILVDEHSPSRYRVQGVLSNLKEFSTDFNCKKKSPMNPDKKCLLWT